MANMWYKYSPQYIYSYNIADIHVRKTGMHTGKCVHDTIRI